MLHIRFDLIITIFELFLLYALASLLFVGCIMCSSVVIILGQTVNTTNPTGIIMFVKHCVLVILYQLIHYALLHCGR
jgi:hypothetical protein